MKRIAISVFVFLGAACGLGTVADNSGSDDPSAAAGLAGEVSLIAADAMWKYNDGAVATDLAWVAPSYSDAAWKSGKGELGYGDGDETTILTRSSAMSARFRHTFSLTNPAGYTNYVAHLIRDDGAVIYVNGKEVARANMPAGAITGATPASAGVYGADEAAMDDITIPASAFTAGTNVVAVEVHQAGASSDLTFWLELTATPVVTAGPTLVAADAIWRYRDNGEAFDSAWRAVGFNDSAWKSGRGEFGYGDGGETTVTAAATTVRFRQTFSIGAPSDYAALVLSLVRDDGAVAYLNGTEIARSNMPAGATTNATLASSNLTGSAESAKVTFAVPTARLVAGTNVLAVEVHQAWATSSDLSFSATLTGTPSGTTNNPPVVVNPPTDSSGVPTTAVLPALPAGATLVFNEEFQDANWANTFSAYENNYMEPNGIKNYWLKKNTVQNAAEGGFLRMTGLKESVTVGGKTYNYTSGMVGTREKGKYFPAIGRYAFAARLPHGHAEWTCIWLRHRNGSGVLEVDLSDQFEADEPGTVKNAIHKPNTESYNLLQKNTFVEDPFAAPKWHVYSVDIVKIDANTVDFKFYTDGKPTSTYRDKKAASWLGVVPVDQTFDIAIDHKIGGTWAGDPDVSPYNGKLTNGTTAAPAGTVPTSKYPSNFDVAWAKVWKF